MCVFLCELCAVACPDIIGMVNYAMPPLGNSYLQPLPTFPTFAQNSPMKHLLLSLLVFTVFTSCNNENKEKQKEETINITSNGTNIAYTKCGTGDTTLLFLHG